MLDFSWSKPRRESDPRRDLENWSFAAMVKDQFIIGETVPRVRETTSSGLAVKKEEARPMSEQVDLSTDEPTEPGGGKSGREDLRRTVNRLVRRHPEVGVAVALLILIGYFAASSPNFATLDSATGILTVAANSGLVALGVCLLMISGEFDISVGSVYLIATLIFIKSANSGVAPPLAFLLTLVACGLIGALNGIIVVKGGISSFIVTLAAMMFYRGLHIIWTGGFSVTYLADKSFLVLVAGNPFSMFRNTIAWWLLVGLILHVVLTRTRYGNWIFATGGNKEAARNVGVPVQRVKIINFALCSLLAGMSGALNIARFMTSQSQLGMGLEFEAITAAVIGGCVLAGGAGSIVGTIMGAVFMSVIRSGLIMLGYSSYIYMPITGIVLLLAVIINRAVSGFKLR